MLNATIIKIMAGGPPRLLHLLLDIKGNWQHHCNHFTSLLSSLPITNRCSKHALVHPLIGVEGIAIPHQYLLKVGMKKYSCYEYIGIYR
jgi:hypothetical protein